MSELVFDPVSRHEVGTIERLLVASYAGLPVSDDELATYRLKWRRADRDTFENPATIGCCTFVTCLDDVPIGLGSFDPRERPERGVIGQNCIVPEYRRQGYGRRQIEEILRRLREMRVRKAIVTTGEHAFFLPGQRMYLACGFGETRRFEREDVSAFGMIEYEREL